MVWTQPTVSIGRQVAAVKMEEFAAIFPEGINLTSVTPLKIVNLAANNSTGNSTSSFCNCTRSLALSVPAFILVFLGFSFCITFFCIYAHRRSTNWDYRSPRPNNRQANNFMEANNIIEVNDTMEAINREEARGLDRVVIESIPIFSYTLVKRLKSQANCSDCAVCLSDFAEDDMLRLLPKCSHAFHPECIDGWLFTHTTCPVCRTSLILTDEDFPTATDFGLLDQQSPPGEVTIVIGNGTGVDPVIDISDDDTTNEASGCDSIAYSLVRVRKETKQPSEWYIATAEGLTAGLHGSCSFVGAHHLQETSGSHALPACSKPGRFFDDVGHGSRSERWGRFPMKPTLVLRTFSESLLPREG